MTWGNMRWGSRASEGDTTAPVVNNYDPVVGTTIAAHSSLSFDVTDNNGEFSRVMITATFATGDWEVVHTGDQFAPRYIASSSRSAIANGFRYTLQRAGGWPSSPTINTYAIDADGNESS